MTNALEEAREALIHLNAAIDNLWNHPDLSRVRSEIPESIKLNISRGQLMSRAALASAQRSDGEGWRPIETAPKDGTRILVWIPQAAWEPTLRPCMAAAHWNTRWDGWEDTAMADLTDHAGFDDWQPTHWRPLPSPPADSQTETQS